GVTSAAKGSGGVALAGYHPAGATLLPVIIPVVNSVVKKKNAGFPRKARIAENPENVEKSSPPGGVPEWPLAPVLKPGDAARRSRVRIPPPPLFSRPRLLPSLPPPSAPRRMTAADIAPREGASHVMGSTLFSRPAGVFLVALAC